MAFARLALIFIALPLLLMGCYKGEQPQQQALLYSNGASAPVEIPRTDDGFFSSNEIRNISIYPLEGCTYARIVVDKFSTPNLHVIRCPNSSVSTNYKSGKHTANTVVIDNEELAKAKATIERAEALNRISEEDKKLLGIK